MGWLLAGLLLLAGCSGEINPCLVCWGGPGDDPMAHLVAADLSLLHAVVEVEHPGTGWARATLPVEVRLQGRRRLGYWVTVRLVYPFENAGVVEKGATVYSDGEPYHLEVPVIAEAWMPRGEHPMEALLIVNSEHLMNREAFVLKIR